MCRRLHFTNLEYTASFSRQAFPANNLMPSLLYFKYRQATLLTPTFHPQTLYHTQGHFTLIYLICNGQCGLVYTYIYIYIYIIVARQDTFELVAFKQTFLHHHLLSCFAKVAGKHGKTLEKQQKHLNNFSKFGNLKHAHAIPNPNLVLGC